VKQATKIVAADYTGVNKYKKREIRTNWWKMSRCTAVYTWAEGLPILVPIRSYVL